MALIEIKDFKGVATQADPNDIGLDFSINNQNFYLDTPGALVKHPGRGSGIDFSNLAIDDVAYWSPSNLKIDLVSTVPPQWICFDTESNKLKMIDGDIAKSPTPTPLNLGSAYSLNTPGSFDFEDHGTEFRMAPDNLNHPPKVLYFISRNFFEGDFNVDEFVVQDATPTMPTTSELSFTVNEFDIGTGTGLNLESGNYSYKVSPVFDGTQELPLDGPQQSIGPSTESKIGQIEITMNKTAATGTAPNKVYGFNPRITSLNIFRETDNTGTYYEVIKIPINTKNADNNSIANNKAIYRNLANYNTANSGSSYTPTYPMYGYATTISTSYSALTASDGIFSMPSVTFSGQAPGGEFNNGAIYTWSFRFFQSSSNDFDSLSAMANSPTFFQTSEVAVSSGTTYDFSNTNGPLDDSAFLALLQKGIVEFHSSRGGFVSSAVNTILGNSDGGYTDVRVMIQRRILRVTSTNNRVLYVGPTQTNLGFDVGKGVFDKSSLIVDLDFAQETKSQRYAGGILTKGTLNTTVIGNVGKAVQILANTENDALVTGDQVNIEKNFHISSVGNQIKIQVNDTGFNNGRMQPFEDELIIDTRYKYSQMMGNRLFVGNVRIDPNNNLEDHPDWVVYSEPDMPDILPAVNYIQIKDQQGGFITGMSKILDSLVVFMTRGVFRLDVTSGNNPASWSLMEADKNVGCIAPKSIASVKDNLFFASYDNIYQITPDFRFHPITMPIRNIYQEEANLENTKIFYDISRDRLICSFGDNRTTNYIYNLQTTSWTVLKYTDSDRKIPSCYGMTDAQEVFALATYTDNTQSGGGGGATP